VTRSLVHKDGHLTQEIPDEIVHKLADHHSQLPGTPLLRSRGQWRKLKKEIQRLKDAGIDPSKITGPGIYYPVGTPVITRLINKVRRLFRHG
jgi:hypothetical protein